MSTRSLLGFCRVAARVSRVTLRASLVACALWIAGQLTPGWALAQEDAPNAAEDRATSFKAVEGAVKEDVPGGPLLVSAYGVILAVIVGYGLRIARLQQSAQVDLERLQRQLGANQQSASQQAAKR